MNKDHAEAAKQIAASLPPLTSEQRDRLVLELQKEQS